MNQQQVQTARLQRWSQDGNARLTLEDAQAWLEAVGFCPLAPLLLPGHPPTPTLLEAILGKPLPQPTFAERASMQSLLARLVQAKVAVPLLLISPPGEQPDFVATLEALPFLYAMRGDRDWKAQPTQIGQGRVSHLALHCWQEIERNGPQTLSVLQRALGNEITEAAALRALCELWGHLRVVPQLQVDDAGESAPPIWELLSRRYPKQVSIGAGMGQPAALSGILSLYLSAVLAASDAEIVAFLSPLASQSKTREMVHGLTATRQLGRIPYEGGMLLHLKDGLPAELLVDLSEPTIFANENDAAARPARGPIRKWEPRSRPEKSDRPAYSNRPERSARPENFVRPERPARRPERSAVGSFAAKKFSSAKPFSPAKKFSSAKKFPAAKPFPSSDAQQRGAHDRPQRSYPNASYPDAKRKSYSDAPRFTARSAASGERPAFRPTRPGSRPGFGAKTFPSKSFPSKSFPSKEKSFSPKEGTREGGAPKRPFQERPFQKRSFPKRFEAKPAFRRPDASASGEPSSREPKSDESRSGERSGGSKPWSKLGGERKFDRPRSDAPARLRADSKSAATSGGKTEWKKPRVAERDKAPAKFKKFDAGKSPAKKFSRDKTSSKKSAPAHADEGAGAQPTPRKEPFWAKPMHPKRKKRD